MAFIKCQLEPMQIFAAHIELFHGQYLETAFDDDGGIGDVVDPGDFELVEDSQAIAIIATQVFAYCAHDRRDFLQIGLVGNPDVQHGIGIFTAHIGHGVDDAVGDEVHIALVVDEPYIAQRDFLHFARLARDFDEVALAHLVFQQQEEAAEKILDQALRAETDGACR